MNQYQSVCYDSTGKKIKESVIVRGDLDGVAKPQFSSPDSIDPNINVQYHDGEVYFVGYVNTSHWGHFLTETLGRCQHLDGPPMTVVSVSDLGPIKEIFPQHTYVVARGAFKTKSLILPTPTMVDCYYVYPEHLQTLRKVANFYGKDPVANRKVYLSRTKVYKFRGQARWTEGETQLQKLLKDAGWSIYHFEDLKVSQQIGILEGAEILTGCIGSAFHNLMLTENNPGKVVYLTADHTNPNYAHHDAILGNDSTYVDCQYFSNRQLARKTIKSPEEVYEYLQTLWKTNRHYYN